MYLMMWTFLAALLLHSGQADLDLCRRDGNYNGACKLPYSYSNSSPHYKVDENRSTLTVFFPVCLECFVEDDRRCKETYTVTLLVYRGEKRQRKLWHSEESFNVCARCNSSTECYSEMAEVTFRHVFTGNYTFEIGHRLTSTYRHPRFEVNTTLDFETANSFAVTSDLQPKRVDRSLRLMIDNLDWDGSHICNWTLLLYECQVSGCCIDNFKNKSKASCQEDIVEYTFTDLKPGNYCVMYQPADERCPRHSSVWSETCKFRRRNASLFPPDAPEPVKATSGNYVLYVALIGAVFVMAAFIWGVMYLRKRNGFAGKQVPSATESHLVVKGEGSLYVVNITSHGILDGVKGFDGKH